jgi:single-strand DNA-binding protein
MNEFKIMGNLTRDPEMKQLQGGSSVTDFVVAHNRKWKDSSGTQREDVLFMRCSAFGKTGEVINQYFKKGSKILVQGHLKQDSWTDTEGKHRTSITGIVERFFFIGCKDSSNSDNSVYDEGPPF